MGRLPAILLYDGDWYKDGVAGCSLGAQGLWLRMMFIGHNSERYGYLQVNGLPIPPDSIARRCGCTLEEYQTYLAELDRNGVPSRTPEGIIFSRRMVRDAQERESERNKKRKQRAPCPPFVPPLVPPLSVNEAVNVKERKKPEKDWSGDDLAHHLLREAGIVPHGELPVVVSQALTLKQKNSGWPMEKVFLHMLERATAAKSARYRGKWIDWFAGGDYDKPPEAWQDKSAQKADRGYIPLKPKA